MKVEFDHLVLACATLAQGIEYVADLTGVAPRMGGKHAAMGTHNALLRLGHRLYLEIIAIDPDAPHPGRPRWFDLDDAGMQAAIGERPCIIHWVARTDALPAAMARAAIDPGFLHSMERGAFRWRITIPDDGSRPGAGLVPTLIQWDVAEHPADGLPPSGLELAQFAGGHPDPDLIRAALASLRIADLLPVTFAREPRLAALLRTPRGLVAL